MTQKQFDEVFEQNRNKLQDVLGGEPAYFQDFFRTKSSAKNETFLFVVTTRAKLELYRDEDYAAHFDPKKEYLAFVKLSKNSAVFRTIKAAADWVKSL